MTVLDALAGRDPSDQPTPPPAPRAHSWLDTVTTVWHDYRYPVILGALIVVVGFLLVSLLVAKVKGHTDRWISALAWIAGFGFSAEGMWIVTTQKAHITPVVALAVFFVGEAFMLNSMTHARAAYLRTTERDKRTGKVVNAGDPGKHGRAVWTIAATMALIVAFASSNLAEAALRAAVPLGVAMLWWNTLTAEGTGKVKGKFAWTPTRLLEQIGALVPDENPDLKAMARERQINAMVIAADRAHAGGWRAAHYERRLRKLARGADAAMMTAVRARVDQAVEAVDRLVPARSFVDVLPPAPWWTVLAPWPYLARLEVFIAGMRTAHVAERATWEARVNGLAAEHHAAVEALQADARRVAAEAEQAALRVVHLAEQLEAVRAERVALQQRCGDVEQAKQAVEALLQRAHADVQRAHADADARRDQEVPAKQSGAGRVKQAKQSGAPNAPKLSDAEAVRAMCNAHPEHDYEWSKREVYRITGAGFGRIDRLLVAIAEHHRSTPQCGCAEQSADGDDDTKEHTA